MSDLLDEVERPLSAAEIARQTRLLAAMRQFARPRRYLKPMEEVLQTKERNRDLLRAEVLAAIRSTRRPTTCDILSLVPRNRNAVHLTILEMEKEGLIHAIRDPRGLNRAAFWSVRPAGLEFLDSLDSHFGKSLEIVVEEGGGGVADPRIRDVEGEVLLGVLPGPLGAPLPLPIPVSGELGLENVENPRHGVEEDGLIHHFPADNTDDSLVEPVDLDEFDVGPGFKEVLELLRVHAADSASVPLAGEEKQREHIIYIDGIADF